MVDSTVVCRFLGVRRASGPRTLTATVSGASECTLAWNKAVATLPAQVTCESGKLLNERPARGSS